MKLFSLDCPNCGAEMTFAEARDQVICPYCLTKHILVGETAGQPGQIAPATEKRAAAGFPLLENPAPVTNELPGLASQPSNKPTERPQRNPLSARNIFLASAMLFSFDFLLSLLQLRKVPAGWPVFLLILCAGLLVWRAPDGFLQKRVPARLWPIVHPFIFLIVLLMAGFVFFTTCLMLTVGFD